MSTFQVMPLISIDSISYLENANTKPIFLVKVASPI